MMMMMGMGIIRGRQNAICWIPDWLFFPQFFAGLDPDWIIQQNPDPAKSSKSSKIQRWIQSSADL